MTTVHTEQARANKLQRERPVEWSAWQTQSSTWARHVIDCDRCFLGKPCSTEPALFRQVVTRWAVVLLDDRPTRSPR